MRDYLKQGTRLKNYTIITKIGEGATCVAYSCQEPNGRRVVIKEYYPINLSIKREDNYLKCSEKDKKRFLDGLQHFKETVQRQVDIRRGKMSPKASVKNQVFDITDSFEWFDTYYYVMPEFSGRVFTQNAEITLYDRIRTCKAIAQYVKGCHELGFLCLDIKPDNIYVLSDTYELPMFFDYDSVISKEDARMGRNLSYSEKWAAPEQIIPDGFKMLSEATDVYALGELVFWSVFDRNSFDEEHRCFSKYDFDKSCFEEILFSDVRDILSEVFNHTIQSLPRKRYANVDILINKLELIIEALKPRKARLLSIIPRDSSLFVGRDEELLKIETVLKERHLAILYGLGGIGKSEIAKHYALSHSYNAVVFLTYRTDLIETINETQFISYMEQDSNETREHFCRRKLGVLADLCDDKTLLVVDNMNFDIAHIVQSEEWRQIVDINCDILITTRCTQSIYPNCQIEVNELPTERMIEVFDSFCHIDSDQINSVCKLLEMCKNHTLFSVIIAKHCKSQFLRPADMLLSIQERGMMGSFQNAACSEEPEKELLTYVINLFPVVNLSDKQKELMYRISLMPESGFSVDSFLSLFNMYSRNDMRDLINEGWLTEDRTRNGIVYMHPLLAEAFLFQRERVDNSLFESICDKFVSESEHQLVERKRQIVLIESLIEKSINSNVHCERFADTLVMYCISERQTINSYKRLKLLRRAIVQYDQIYGSDYSLYREITAIILLQTLIESGNLEEAKTLCDNHIRHSIRNTNWIFTSYFVFCKNVIRTTMASDAESFFKQVLAFISMYADAYILFVFGLAAVPEVLFVVLRAKRKKDVKFYHADISRLKQFINIRKLGAEASEADDVFSEILGLSIADYYVSNWYSVPSETRIIRFILSLYRTLLLFSVNGMNNMSYRKASIKLGSGFYKSAINDLKKSVAFYQSRNCDKNRLYATRRAIGDIYLIKHDYNMALSEYEKCKKMGEHIIGEPGFDMQIRIGYLYCILSEYEKCNKLILQIEAEKWSYGTDENTEYGISICFLKTLLLICRLKESDKSHDILILIDSHFEQMRQLISQFTGRRYKIWDARIRLLRVKLNVNNDSNESLFYQSEIKSIRKVFERHLCRKSMEWQECNRLLRELKK